MLLAIDGERISDDGTFGAGPTRLPLSHLFDMKPVGQTVPLQIWRDGQVVDVRWRAGRYPVLDRMRSRGAPRYLVYGGLVFVPLSYASLSAANASAERRAAALRAVSSQMWGADESGDREIVLLAGILADPVNEGVHVATPLVLDELNGQPVRSLAELARTLDDSQRSRDVFALAPPNRSLIAVDHQAATAGRAAFLQAQGIPSDRNL